MKVFGLLATALCVQLAAGQSLAQDTTVTPDMWMQSQAAGILRAVQPDRPLVRDAFERHFRNLFRMQDVEGKGVSAESRALERQIRIAQIRAGLISQRLLADIDGDGTVTSDELRRFFYRTASADIAGVHAGSRPSPEQIETALARLMRSALAYDANVDGRITPDEITAGAHSEAVTAVRGHRGSLEIPVGFDANGDGVISSEEFLAAADRTFRDIDSNGDGQISSEEAGQAQARFAASTAAIREAERVQMQRDQMAARARTCRIPPVPAEGEFVLAAVYEGKALSTVGIGGDDAPITVSDLTIEPGSSPIRLVLLSHVGQIWRITGATDRVAQVSVHAAAGGRQGAGRAGVVGIARERVSFIPSSPCLTGILRELSSRNAPSREAENQIEAAFGRKPTRLIATYGLAAAAVPSGNASSRQAYQGAVRLATAGPSAATWREMLRFNPGGLVEIDPTSVIAPLPVATFTVLPQQAGLARLVEEGALAVGGSKQVITVAPPGTDPASLGEGQFIDVPQENGLPIGAGTIVQGQGIVVIDGRLLVPPGSLVKRVSVPAGYRILRKITLPSGLHGAHSVTFVLPAGVPAPDGDPGHSCIVHEDTGRRAAGSCR